MTSQKDEELTQYALVGKGYCGRGVRLRRLSIDDHEAALKSASRSAIIGTGEQSPEQIRLEQLDVNMAITNACVRRMIAQVTKRAGYKTAEDVLALSQEDWASVTDADLMGVGAAALKYTALFGAKDDSILERIYHAEYNVTKDEVDAILGKAVPVAGTG